MIKYFAKKMSTSTTVSLDQAMERLEALGINLLALDFDQTILSVHTGGRWQGSTEELLPFVRPIFADLMREVVKNNSSNNNPIQVAVVTYTGQIHLVRAVLEAMVGVPAAERIPIRGNDRSWVYSGAGSLDGKQPHMASAVEELVTTNPGIHITKLSTLLIDDDRKNIRHALKEGTRAIWFNPEKPERLYSDIAKLP